MGLERGPAMSAPCDRKHCNGHIAVRIDGNRAYFEYTFEGEYVRRKVPLAELTSFLTHKERPDANLGAKGLAISFERFVAEHFLPKDARRRQKDNTFKRTKEVAKALNQHFGSKDLHRIDKEAWDDYQELRADGALGRKCSPGGIRKEYVTFRAALNYAVELKFIQANPFAGIRPSKLGLFDDNRCDIWFTIDELGRIFLWIPEEHRDLFEFRMWTGARPEEAARFGAANINWEAGTIWIETIKKKRRQGSGLRKRVLIIKSLGPKFEALLRRLKPHPVTGLMFARPDTGQPYSEAHLVGVFQAAVKKAGVVKRKLPRPYDLCGTFAVHRAMAGVSFRQLQAELGHDTLTSIKNYLDEARHFTAKSSIFFGVDVTAGWRE